MELIEIPPSQAVENQAVILGQPQEFRGQEFRERTDLSLSRRRPHLSTLAGTTGFRGLMGSFAALPITTGSRLLCG
jgi:hypothetical protein